LDYKGWYNRKDLQFMRLEDIILLSAMGPPGGGRTFITNRYTRHFNVIAYTELSTSTITEVFSVLVSSFLRRFNENIRNSLDMLIRSVLSIFEQVKEIMLPTPAKSHYTFNMRDIWKVFQGICSASPKTTPDVTAMVRLWYHENMRVFHDRLTTEDDRIQLKGLLKNGFTQFGLAVD
jgi:dynein heavy chain